ncbi:MAG: hypothetical protein VCD00_01830 [Candidatus Hydrogenedentota bacterium]
MRIAPIEQPNSITMRVAHSLSQRMLGKVITPIKVVYSRCPGAIKLGHAVQTFMAKGTTLDPEFVFLLSTHTAQLNNCAFCVDIGRAMDLKNELPLNKANALHEYDTNSLFSEAERAALDYLKEINQNKDVSDVTFAKLQEQYNDTQIVEITVVNAAENYYNLINIPLEIETDDLCALVPQRHKKHATRNTR